MPIQYAMPACGTTIEPPGVLPFLEPDDFIN
jgi:hypothetical protein